MYEILYFAQADSALSGLERQLNIVCFHSLIFQTNSSLLTLLGFYPLPLISVTPQSTSRSAEAHAQVPWKWDVETIRSILSVVTRKLQRPGAHQRLTRSPPATRGICGSAWALKGRPGGQILLRSLRTHPTEPMDNESLNALITDAQQR